MVDSRSASPAARSSRDFDALAAAARRVVRGRRAQHEALNNYIATLLSRPSSPTMLDISSGQMRKPAG
jgi:hypothetical protein